MNKQDKQPIIKKFKVSNLFGEQISTMKFIPYSFICKLNYLHYGISSLTWILVEKLSKSFFYFLLNGIKIEDKLSLIGNQNWKSSNQLIRQKTRPRG